MYKTAKQAQEESLKCVNEDQLNHISEQINRAIKRGAMAISIDPIEYNRNVLEKLINDGYTIVPYLGEFEGEECTFYTIAWARKIGG